MLSQCHIGKRLSYDGNLCTVRYVGLVKDTKGEWLGVEWDNSERGKHDGNYGGLKYFECVSPTAHPASFVRPSRPSDAPRGFCSALRKKYASTSVAEVRGVSDHGNEINISGKTVEEVGFQKVENQLANLSELRVVALDGLCITGLLDRPWKYDDGEWEVEREKLEAMGLKIRELDLGRNLLERWEDVRGICTATSNLRRLSVSGNRFHPLSFKTASPTALSPFQSVVDLDLSAIMVTWADLEYLLPTFPSLTTLSLASNLLGRIHIQQHFRNVSLKNLDLASNKITSLSDLAFLDTVESSLQFLSLRSNPITTIVNSASGPDPKTNSLRHLDLGNTQLEKFSVLNDLYHIIPSLTSLITTGSPLASLPDARLETIARIASLQQLNYTFIADKDRLNAEIWYLNRIAKSSDGLLRAKGSDEGFRKWIQKEHPRYWRLCEIYGEPEGMASAKKAAESGSQRGREANEDFLSSTSATAEGGPKMRALGTRLIAMTFFTNHKTATSPSSSPTSSGNLPSTSQAQRTTTLKTPPSTPITALKSLVIPLLFPPHLRTNPSTPTSTSTFINPFRYRFVWETGEYDPPGKHASTMRDGGGWSDESEDDEDDEGPDAWRATAGKKAREKKNRDDWVQREVELSDGVKEVGYWIAAGAAARVRVEARR